MVDHIVIRVERGGLTIRLRNHGPQLLDAFTTAVTHMERNDLASFGVHREPNPLRIGLLLDKACHCVGFNFEALDHHILVARDRLDMPMIRQGLETGDDKSQEPLEPDLDRTANAAKRETFQQQALNEITRFIRDEVVLEAIDKLTATVFALMVLFAVVNVTIFLLLGGLAARTDISDDHTHGELPVLSQRFEQP